VKISATTAAWQGKCPRCREGKMFEHTVFSVNFMDMHENCPKCGLHYEVEKGFFWGAMYFSYALTVAIFIAGFFGTRLLIDAPTLTDFLRNILIPIVLFAPASYRISRILMLHLFGGVDYDENAVQNKIKSINTKIT
jgi:uncharacterized protein (DUF983 family)